MLRILFPIILLMFPLSVIAEWVCPAPAGCKIVWIHLPEFQLQFRGHVYGGFIIFRITTKHFILKEDKTVFF